MNMPIISVKNLSKQFKVARRAPGMRAAVAGLFSRAHETVRAVSDISFTIEEGEFVGFLGPNGAGKTTTLKMLSGILFPSGGAATVAGYIPWKRDRHLQQQFALVMGQKNLLWWDLSPEESFLLAKEIYGLPQDRYEKSRDRLVSLLGIDRVIGHPVRNLSLGERMKCELAAALLHEPRVIYLDEPTIGLDVVSQQNIRDFLQKYNKETGATIILTSHYMQDVERLCSRVILIDTGELQYDGGLDELKRRYGSDSVVELSFAKHVSASSIAAYGEVTHVENGAIRISMPKNEVKARVARILAALPVETISIRENSLEDVMRRIYQGGE